MARKKGVHIKLFTPRPWLLLLQAWNNFIFTTGKVCYYTLMAVSSAGSCITTVRPGHMCGLEAVSSACDHAELYAQLASLYNQPHSGVDIMFVT